MCDDSEVWYAEEWHKRYSWPDSTSARIFFQAYGCAVGAGAGATSQDAAESTGDGAGEDDVDMTEAAEDQSDEDIGSYFALPDDDDGPPRFGQAFWDHVASSLVARIAAAEGQPDATAADAGAAAPIDTAPDAPLPAPDASPPAPPAPVAPEASIPPGLG